MTESDRTGGKTRLMAISEQDAQEMLIGGLDAPKIYLYEPVKECRLYFCEPAEFERWCAARAADQAGDAQ